MGTDIHMGMEKRGPDGVWHYCGAMRENPWYGKWRDEPRLRPVTDFFGRCYDLFAILADVRNGRGFAGVKTGDGFNVIAEPKGLPGDVDLATLEALSGDHTPSWLTLGEIEAFDWEQVTFRTGLVDDVDKEHPDGGAAAAIQAYADEHGILPDGTWVCGGISGPREEQFKRVTWPTTYRQAAWTDDWDAIVKSMREESGGDPSSVRVVFDFDS